MRKLKNESEFQRFIRKSVGYAFPNKCRLKKNHGNQFSERGVSDLDGHVNGFYIAIECKMWNGRPTREQTTFLKNIHITGGIALFAVYNYLDGIHTCYFVPAEIPFSYRTKMFWLKSKLVSVQRDPNNPNDKEMVEVFDCTPIKTILEMR